MFSVQHQSLVVDQRSQLHWAFYFCTNKITNIREVFDQGVATTVQQQQKKPAVADLCVYILCMFAMFVYLFLSLSLIPVLSPVSLVFCSFTQSTLSRKVPPCKPGPAQGFFLLKGSFSLPYCKRHYANKTVTTCVWWRADRWDRRHHLRGRSEGERDPRRCFQHALTWVQNCAFLSFPKET